jgi:RNase P subunit RPR2
MTGMKAKSTSKESMFCNECNKTTPHEVTFAKRYAGLPKTLRDKKVVKTICLECGCKKFLPHI